MTQDDIMRIAWDVGILMRSHKFQADPTKLERFAERIAAAEREACAKVCEDYTDRYAGSEDEGHGYEIAAAIRARGEA